MRRGVRRSAYHEAGHAAVALHLGVGVREVTIQPESVFGGTCRLDVGVGYATTTLAVEDHILIALCGPVAEARIHRRRLDTVLASTGRHDLKAAMRYIAALRGAARPFAAYVDLARYLVREHWPAVERVALALLERGSLDAATVADLAAGHTIPDRERLVPDRAELHRPRNDDASLP